MLYEFRITEEVPELSGLGHLINPLLKFILPFYIILKHPRSNGIKKRMTDSAIQNPL